MTPVLSDNTQAILLLTAPLIAGRGATVPDLLSPGEYKGLARHLRELNRQPADLLTPEAPDLFRECRSVVEGERLQRLLGRGFVLSQVVERWRSRAIWVVSRADPEYPKRLKTRLRENCPAVLYGCGGIGLLESGGLAVVGSRNVDESLIEYAMGIGRLAARARTTTISGGAKGIDQAAMRGALDAGGNVCGVLADSLEQSAMIREHRNLLMDGQLVLISPYDPSAGFNVGNAMQRNKLIYALSSAALVVSTDLNKGGTWSGAIEQLEKLRLVPLYVRSTEPQSAGLAALVKKGAMPWPDPQSMRDFKVVFDKPAPSSPVEAQAGLELASDDDRVDGGTVRQPVMEDVHMQDSTQDPDRVKRVAKETSQEPPLGIAEPKHAPSLSGPYANAASLDTEGNPSDALFSTVRKIICNLLQVPMKDSDIAAALGVSNAQAKLWLKRLFDEGALEKRKKPVVYALKQTGLFE